eukprot:6180704-Pleurochrysis_carterae.AAC.3
MLGPCRSTALILADVSCRCARRLQQGLATRVIGCSARRGSHNGNVEDHSKIPHTQLECVHNVMEWVHACRHQQLVAQFATFARRMPPSYRSTQGANLLSRASEARSNRCGL